MNSSMVALLLVRWPALAATSIIIRIPPLIRVAARVGLLSIVGALAAFVVAV